MENCPFIDDFTIKTSIYEGFSMAMLNKQMVESFNDPTDKNSTTSDAYQADSWGFHRGFFAVYFNIIGRYH